MIERKILIISVGIGLIVIAIIGVSLALIISSESDDSDSTKQLAKGSDILLRSPLIDGHNDLPMNIFALEKNELGNFAFDSDLRMHPIWGTTASSHTDLPRLREGMVAGQFWVAYVGCNTQYKDAVERTLQQIDVIKRLIVKYPAHMMYATKSSDIMKAFDEKKIASFIAVEGGHSIDSRLSVLRLYYELGVRYMTLTHSCNAPWADASPVDDDDDNGTAAKKNLTTWGKNVIVEMNRIGMMVDLSHVSYGVMKSVLDIATAPVIFSHSSSFTVFNHHRNVRDDVLLKLKENNGIIMINLYPDFVGGNTMAQAIKHFNYIRDLIGAQHIGIGGDYDGVGRTLDDMADVSKYPALFDRLATSGLGYEPWNSTELAQMAGLNLIRVLNDVEQISEQLKNDIPKDSPIPDKDIFDTNPNQECRTDLTKPPQSDVSAAKWYGTISE